MFEERAYRGLVEPEGLVRFTVVVKETDLLILAETGLSDLAREVVLKHRHGLENYIARHPEFLSSLVPLEVRTGSPEVVRRMAAAAARAGVGPMAAVAGAFAELVGEALSEFSGEVIVENGGDIYIRSSKPRVVAIHAGDSPLSGRIGINIHPGDTPLGVCTSSGRVGHSLSLGRAHAACVVSASAPLADAAATAVGNRVKVPADIAAAVEFARGIEGVDGVLVVSEDRLGAWGEVELVRL